MPVDTVNRRDFLKFGAMAGVAAVAVLHHSTAQAAPTRCSLAECLEMSPVAMAEASGPATAAWADIRATAAAIRNPAIRTKVQGILENPAPTLVKGMDAADKKAIHAELTRKGLLKDVAEKDFLPPVANGGKASQPFYSAPGSGYQSHHAYPGGLCTHTGLNTRVSIALYDGYDAVYNYQLDRDVVVAAQLLHDLHKPWVFQWGPDGESRTERPLAGTGEHHPLSVAESIVRGLPAEVVVAQACAHDHPGTPADEAQVVGWIEAAAIIAGVDPIKRGLLAADGKTLPLPRRMEGFVTHLGDHDWVLTGPAVQWTLPVLEKVAVRDYGISRNDLKKKPFHQFRNYVYSQLSSMGLYEIYAARGEDEAARTIHGVVAPA